MSRFSGVGERAGFFRSLFPGSRESTCRASFLAGLPR